MQLTFKDRIAIQSIYPKADSMLTQMMVRDIEKKVRITQGEYKTAEVEEAKNGGIIWNDVKARAIVISVDFSDTELSFLKGRVSDLDKEKKITATMLELCMKINDAEIKTETETEG